MLMKAVLGVSGVPPSVFLSGSAASYLMYADVPFHIPMTRHTTTVSYKLDPFGTKTDFDLCNALEKAHLSKDLLDSQVAESGGNLSAGQRQLLCFARALLFRAPIVIMDEPTASCDQETDGIIQTMVRNEFKGTTVVTIAHRLETVVDSDAILVLGAGKVLEYGIPADLLAKESGDLTQMARALGSATHSHLIAKANEAKEAAVRK